MTIEEALDLGLQHHHFGRLAEAESLYRQILTVQPAHVEAMHHLGLIAHQAGRYDIAVDLIRQALAIDPNHAGAHSNLGEAWRMMERPEEAIAAYRRALAIDPDHVNALNNLGNVLRDRGELDEAVAVCRRAIALEPGYAEAYNNLGNALTELGQVDEAILVLARALTLKPDYLEAHYNLGIGLQRGGRLEEATLAYQRALAIRPDFVKAHINLGNTLTQLGRFDEAIATLGGALELQPGHAQIHYNLGIAFQLRGQLDNAVAAYRRAFELDDNFAEARNNLGHVLAGMGRTAEAIAAHRRALALQPDCATTHSNLIFTLQLLTDPERDRLIIEEQRLWNRRFSDPFKPFIAPHANERSPERRLRIGYVSTDFRDHVAGRNLRPLFRHHDHEQFEIFCYSGVFKSDAVTEEFRQQADEWRSTVGVSDEALAKLIRHDAIDILVDLSQHTADNRLPVFARQPAPVQLSFAAYPGSTGVEAIRYRISDRWLEASASEIEVRRSKIAPRRDPDLRSPNFDLRPAERVCLIDSFWCYDPAGMELVPNDLPASRNGYATFGSLNNFSKINQPLLELWARVLAGVENSRLVILAGAGSHREQAVQFLASKDIEPRRVEFVGHLPRGGYLARYHQLDVILDTFPYNGHTTSLDALWMGVPVISLVGSQPISRAGLSQLSNLGLPELAAFSADEYVHIANVLAHDLPRLAILRATLRSRLEHSVLMDAPRFARQIESTYRALWRQWCESRSHAR